MTSQNRIAVVQYGDYASALQLVQTGGKELYSGMRHSVEAMQELFRDTPHLVVSLNAQPTRTVIGNGIYVGVPAPKPFLWRRGILNKRFWAWQVCKELEEFQPTHLLMRAAGYVALRALDKSSKHGWPTLAMFANNFASEDRFRKGVERKLVKYLNAPQVMLVGNHRKISAESLVDLGVNPEKVIAYDWPAPRNPSDYSPKKLEPSKPVELIFAANMIVAKGIGDLIEAVGVLRRRGLDIRLTAFGTGVDREKIKALAAQIAPDAITFPGNVENDTLFAAMRNSTVMCVATRPRFQEGGSLVLTEALASRTPTVLSDQIMFKQTYRDGEGIRFFKAGDPESLADTIQSIVSDEHGYALLSESTTKAFERSRCKTTFADLLSRWREAINSP